MDLDKDDVVTSPGSFTFKGGNTLKISELYEAINNYVGQDSFLWFCEPGVPCRVLRVEGGGWKTGRMRFRLEFIPDDLKL